MANININSKLHGMNYNKLSVILLLITLISLHCYLFDSSKSIAATADTKSNNPIIGTVDLLALLVFHPAMGTYDPFTKAFLKNPTGLPTTSTRRTEINKARINELQEKLKELENRMGELRARFDAEFRQAQAEFDAKLPGLSTAAAHLETYRHNLRQNNLSTSFTSQMRALQIQASQIQEAINKEMGASLSSRYTSPEETNQRFAAVFAEVQRITQQVAAKKGIAAVFDSSVIRLAFSPGSDRAPDLSSNFEYGDVLAQKPPSTLENDQMAIEGFYDLQKSRAISWYRNRLAILQPFQSLLGRSFIVTGGIDITDDVMKAILDQYKIDSRIQNLILEAIHASHSQ